MTIYHDMTSSYIKLEKEYFKSAAKSLRHRFNEHIQDPPNKMNLSLAQECLANALGFRNTDSLLHAFEKKDPKNYIKNPKEIAYKFLSTWSVDKIKSMFYFLLELNPVTTYTSSAKLLLDKLIVVLVHMRDQEEILLDSNIISEYLKLKNIITLLKTRRDFPSTLKMGLHDYLSGTLSLNITSTEVIISDLAHAEHSSIMREFVAPLSILAQFEQCDPLVISPSWYHAVYHNDVSANYDDNYQPIDNFKRVYRHERLNEDNLRNFYQALDKSGYDTLTGYNTGYGNTGFEISSRRSKDNSICLRAIDLLTPLASSSYLDDTWLKDFKYIGILQGLIKNKQFQNFYLSDLMLYAFDIINTEKRELYINFISLLLKNYDSVVKKSHQLSEF